MRRFGSLLVGASLALSAAHAGAQVPAPTAPFSAPAPIAAPPVATPPPAAPGAGPVEDPPYEPAAHGGLSYGAWLQATRGTARRSTGMMITGISLVLLGATLMGFGTGVYASAGSSCSPTVVPVDGGPASSNCGAPTGHATGMALLGAGLVTLGIGVPLTVLGAAEVPRAEAAGRGPAPSLAFSFGVRSTGLTLRF